MAELFGVQRPAISKNLKNIFESGELVEKEVVSILEHTTQHGAIERFFSSFLIISKALLNAAKALQWRLLPPA